MSTNEEFVLRNDTSQAGLRRLHLLSVVGPLDRQAVMERYGINKEEIQAALEYEKEGTWHLSIYWRTGNERDD